MIDIKIKNILKTKNKSKYWLVKNMGGGYQAISRLMNNETTGIHFDTLDKLCEILECTPGDILTLEERKKK